MARVVTVGEGAEAYDVLMEVGEEAASTSTVEKLPRAVAEKYSKADLVDYVSADEEEEDEGTDDA
jgi:hypothetical protein